MPSPDDNMTVPLGDILPDPLTPFEEYMFRDNHPGYTMMMPLTLYFKGSADLDALRVSFQETAGPEPLFRAAVKREKGRWNWCDTGETPALLPDHDGVFDGTRRSGVESIAPSELEYRPGVHCRYTPVEDGLVVRFQVHHAVCDGLSTILFLGNWFARYGRLIGDTDGLNVFPPDPERLRERTDLRIAYPHPLPRRTVLYSILREAGLWGGRRPIRLRSDATNGQDESGLPRLLWNRLSPELSGALSETAKQLNVSLNTFFIVEYFRFLKNWIRSTDVHRGKWIRLLVPTNLRKKEHRGIPASNMLGYAFLDRRLRDDFDAPDLYRRTQETVDLIKTWSMGAMFLAGVDICRRIPFGFPAVLSKRFCHSTSIFSNIGNPCRILPQDRFRESGTIRVGRLELRQLIGAPPVRPNTPVSCGLIRHGDELTLSHIVDVGEFGLENGKRFQRMFLEQIERAVSL